MFIRVLFLVHDGKSPSVVCGNPLNTHARQGSLRQALRQAQDGLRGAEGIRIFTLGIITLPNRMTMSPIHLAQS